MKKILSIMLLLLLITAVPTASANSPKIIDTANLLTSSEISNLEITARKLADTYMIDAVILTVDSLDGRPAASYADDYFDGNGYGSGNDGSGVLFLLSMQEREWYVSTHSAGTSAVTYQEIGEITDQILDHLSSGNYYDAFANYLDLLEVEFRSYRNGETDAIPFSDTALRLGIALLIGAAIAAIALFIMRSSMNTAKHQSCADSYIVNGTYDLYRHQDFFLYSRTSRTRKAENNSGGGTHRSSSGRSHGGRGGRF